MEWRERNPLPTLKEKFLTFFQDWRDSNFIEKVFFVLLLPIFLLGYLILIPMLILTILFSPLLLIVLVGGIFIYTIPSIIIGGFIDILRQLFVRNKGVLFEKWKYMDKMLFWWGFTPYGMSLQGYIDFKRNL
tara:strand:- start:566 stop:961 length:396 start_codon:yes stop_codon:yes gene_type:complete